MGDIVETNIFEDGCRAFPWLGELLVATRMVVRMSIVTVEEIQDSTIQTWTMSSLYNTRDDECDSEFADETDLFVTQDDHYEGRRTTINNARIH
jgi:hypothetical protein